MKHSQSLLNLLTIGNWTTFDLVTLSGQNHDEEKMARELVNLLCEVQCSSETTAGIFEWCSHESNQSLEPKHKILFTHNRLISTSKPQHLKNWLTRSWFAWKELTGRAMATYSETWWWSRWEVLLPGSWEFGDVLPFLQSHPEFSPVTTAKLVQDLTLKRTLWRPSTNWRLMVQLYSSVIKSLAPWLLDCFYSYRLLS